MSPALGHNARQLAYKRCAVLMAGVLVERLGVARQQSMHLRLFQEVTK